MTLNDTREDTIGRTTRKNLVTRHYGDRVKGHEIDGEIEIALNWIKKIANRAKKRSHF